MLDINFIWFVNKLRFNEFTAIITEFVSSIFIISSFDSDVVIVWQSLMPLDVLLIQHIFMNFPYYKIYAQRLNQSWKVIF